jgi:hypothetical protein
LEPKDADFADGGACSCLLMGKVVVCNSDTSVSR